MEPFDLDELHALPIPRCTTADLGGLPAEYLAAFVAPRLNKTEDGTTCLGCGEVLFRTPEIMSFILGATFEWGIAHGEGHCSRCGYPTRMYHRLPEGTATFPLQYHPDEIEEKS